MTLFTPTLLRWYKEHGRMDLPWRNITDPYLIWVSEVILQQTQVAQGLNYYLQFIQAFPTFKDLAVAQEDDVLRLWQGLGYYSRARNMHAAAQYIADREKFPATYEEIRNLKGIGEYTAAAICSFAYNQPYAVLDGNVYRVLSRYFGISTPIDTTAGKKEFSYLAYELLDPKNSAKYNSAIMDFGALQCRPKAPNCQQCPLQETCSAYIQNNVEELPVKSKKVKIRERFFTYLVFTHSNTIFLRKRPAGDIWQGLYEPLLIENNNSKNITEIINTLSSTLPNQTYTISPIAESVSHVLTHQRLNINFYDIKLETIPEFVRKDFTAVKIESIHEYGMPQVVKKILINYFMNK